MNNILDLLSGEIERLFSSSEMKELCTTYLGVDPSSHGIEDTAKSVFAKRIVEYCNRNDLAEAVADAVLALKKTAVDPRLQQALNSESPKEPLRSGVEFNEYVVDSFLGEDEIGENYSCRQPGLAQQYKMTTLRRDRAENKRVAGRYLMLMRLLKNNPAPSVASVKETGSLDDGRPYAISAMVGGTALSERIPMSPLHALNLIEGVIDALESIHLKGIVHANLSIDNVCLLSDDDDDFEVVLTGLGADRLLSNSSPPIGIAPEMLRTRRADIRTDIYGLGALLYHIITGKPMFDGPLPVDAAAAHAILNPPSVSSSADTPAASAIDKLIAYFTAKDPGARPRNMDMVRRKIEELKRSVEQIEAQTNATGTKDDIGLSAATFLQYPGDIAALNALLADAQASNAWRAAIEVIEEAASSLDDPAQTRYLLLNAANLAFKKTKDYVKALSIYEYFLSGDPDDDEVLSSVMGVLEAAGRYEELIEKLADRINVIQDPAERIRTLSRIGSIYEKKLKNYESAFSYYSACLTGTATDLELLEQLEKLAEKAGLHENLAASLGQAAQAAESVGDAETALALYEKLGRVYLEKLEQPGYALTCFQKVLQYRPNDISTLKSVADMYRNAQQWMELAQVTMSLAEMETQPTFRRNYMVDAAEVLYKRVGNAEQALSLLDSVISEDPGHRGALDIMTSIFEANQDFARLANVLNEGLQSASNPAEEIEVRIRLGSICEKQLGDVAAAKNHYEKAVLLNPSCLDALRGLDRIYLKEGNKAALRDNLEAQLTCEMTPNQKIETRVRLADLYEEEFKNADKAVHHLEAVVTADDSNRYALLTLTRLYRRLERWEDLAAVLEKRAKFASDDEKKGLLKERADVIRDKLKDSARAIQALTEVTSLGVDDALESLAKTQEEAGDFESAVSTLQKISDAAADLLIKQNIMLRVAMIQLDKMGDVDSTVLTLRKARDLNPSSLDVLSLLARAMIAKRNFAEALMILGQQAELQDNASAKGRILASMGAICFDNLGDSDRAMVYYRQALAFDESNFDAAFNLLKLYRQAHEIEEAIPLYRRWADAADMVDPETKVALFTDMGDTYVEAQRIEDAYKAFSRAVAVTGVPIPPELMIKFAKTGFEREEYAEVQERLASYLQTVGGALPVQVQEPLQVCLAEAYLKQDNHIDAHKYLKQVLAQSPNNLDARILLCEVHEKRGDFKQMAESVKEVTASLPAGDMRKVDLLRRAGAVTAEKLRDVEGGINLLKQALAIKENDRAILAELLKIYTASKNFNELVEVILKIADQVEDASQKVRYYISAAKVYRREIGNINKAILYFEKALDLNPQDPDANRAIIETLEQNMAWDKLELHYKKMIARLPKDAAKEDRLIVLKPLFELLSKKLKKKSDAAVIGEAIYKLSPEDSEHAEHLAELYGWELEYSTKSIKLHRELLAKNTARADSVRMLYRIFSAQGNPDKTWCSAAVLSLLNACTPEEHRYYKDYRPSDLQSFTNVLDQDQWARRLLPKEMDQTVTSIFSIIQNVIFASKGQPLSRYGLDLSQAIDVTQSQYTATAFVNFAAGTLGLTPPPFFFLQSAGPGFQVLETAPPVLVSDGNEQGFTDRVATAFVLGQQLSLFYPGLFVSQMASSGTEMLSWLLASIRMFVPTLPVPDNMAGQISDKLAPLRSSLDDFTMERLQGHVHTFVSKSSNEVNLKKWSKAVHYAQDRAGLLLCGDLSVAVKTLREREKDETMLADRLRAITLFAVSEEHFELRAHLGAALRSA